MRTLYYVFAAIFMIAVSAGMAKTDPNETGDAPAVAPIATASAANM